MIEFSLVGRFAGGRDAIQLTIRHGIIASLRRLHDNSRNLPFITPGLVDLQVNGFLGCDVNDPTPSPASIISITHELRIRGITTWVPTVISATEQEICRRIDAVTSAIRASEEVRAAIPFIHVEGPFISGEDGPRGSHERNKIREMDVEELKRWCNHGVIGYVTVSPHTDQAVSAIAEITSLGIGVSLGHTNASHQQLVSAVDQGATLSTHLGNGIGVSIRRHPNPIWTQLADDRLQCGLIADGHHLPAATFIAMTRALGMSRAFVVSDATEVAGKPPGQYFTSVGGDVLLDPSGRLSQGSDGILAGSAASLSDCLRWIISSTPIAVCDAIRMVSTTPGEIVQRLAPINWSGSPGRLRVGAKAEVCVMDEHGNIEEVIFGSERIRDAK